MLGGFKTKKPTKRDAVIDQVSKEAANVMLEMLYQAEDYIAAANIVITLVAMEKVFGDLKTFPRRLNSVLEQYNTAAEFVDEVGVVEVYKQLSEKYGIDFEFDDGFDINSIKGNAPQENIKMRLTYHKGESQ